MSIANGTSPSGEVQAGDADIAVGSLDLRCNVQIPKEPQDSKKEQVDAQSVPIEDTAVAKTEKTRTTLSFDERIAQVVDWTKEQIDFQPQFSFFINLGNTCNVLEETTKAIEYFEQARKLPDKDHFQVLVALAHAHWELKNRDEAITLLNETLDILRTRFQANEPNSEVDNVFQEVLEDLAGYYEEAEQPGKAVPLYEEALKVKATDIRCRWRLLKALCKIDQVQRAIELLQNWSEHSENYGGKRLSDSLFLLVEDQADPTELRLFIHAMQDETLRSLIMEALGEAIRTAKKQSHSAVQIALLYMQGTAAALSSDVTLQERAVDFWEDTFRVPAPEQGLSWSNQDLLVTASSLVIKYRFDSARTKLITNPDMTVDEKDALRQELKKQLQYTSTVLPEMYLWSGIDPSTPYIASFDALIGHQKAAREMLKYEVATAVSILTDADDENDYIGILTLIRVLLYCDDKVSAITAWSMLDRRYQKTKAAKSNNGSTTVEALDMHRGCDGCSKLLSMSDDEGVWWCQYCPDLDFCSSCHQKKRKGTLDTLLCSQNHEFVRLYPMEYTDEEAALEKVRIEWEMEDKGLGYIVRKGGRVIDTSEWLDQIRRLFELPELSRSEEWGELLKGPSSRSRA